MTAKTPLHDFSESDMEAFRPELKVGILATVNPAGQPHLTFISTLMASDPQTVVWGQFVEGLSKEFIRQNPRTAFLIMSLDKNLWRGKATYTRCEKSGVDYDFYNNVPMFRYNAYFGVHTVYYMDLVEHYGREPLPMGSVIFSSLTSLLAKSLSSARGGAPVLNGWSKAFISRIGIPKFLAYVGADGYPIIIPLLQAQAAGRSKIIFSLSAYRDELETIPAGAPVALLGLSLNMEVVLMRGVYQGIRRPGGMRCGLLQLDWLYNPMPPVPQQVYPPVELKAVTEF